MPFLCLETFRVSPLVRWGANGLAFRTSYNQLFLIQTTLVPSNEPVPTGTPTAQPTPAPTPAPLAEVRQLALTTKDIIYDKTTQRIYSSVPSHAGANGNSITPINPVSGVIEQSVFIGSEPGKLALSDNGQYLYTSLDGAASIRRMTVATRTPGLQFPVGNDGISGLLTTADMAVMPGSPETIAVSRVVAGSYNHRGVAVYDNGVRRTNVSNDYPYSNVIEYSSDPSIIYGYETQSSGFSFNKLGVTAAGVAVIPPSGRLFSGYSNDIKFDNGLIYALTGEVVEPEARTLAGKFMLIDPDISTSTYIYAIATDSQKNRVYFLTSSQTGVSLRAFDMRTFLPLGYVNLTGVNGTPGNLIRWGANGLAFRTSSNQLFLVRTSLVPTLDTVADFDGDGKTDISVFRPSAGNWFITNSSNAAFRSEQFGITSDVIVPGDYDGDGKADTAVFRPETGIWYILRSSNNTLSFQEHGTSADIPVAADYDGDNKTDMAFFRPADGTWHIRQSFDGSLRTQQFGLGTDKPVRGDFDGDGKYDVAVFRPGAGSWYIRQSSNGTLRSQPFGNSTDVPVAGDYDGDGKSDVAVYRPSEGAWYVWLSLTATLKAEQFGISADRPAPGDYDGDGLTDFAVFRPETGAWYVLQSTSGFKAQQFGTNGDQPVPSANIP